MCPRCNIFGSAATIIEMIEQSIMELKIIYKFKPNNEMSNIKTVNIDFIKTKVL
uniref:Uncharacterized protein n=1 Tax=Rhizophagus irregularis (strain DAOM 181602 / DAOM 197198 / MUCL 43194) TaxID=747089 RepID=U9T190_RHIID